MKTALCMLVLLCGCAVSLQPPLPPPGSATRAAFALQLLDPDTSRARRPVVGMDGRSAAAAHQRYQKSFSEAPQESVSVVTRK